MRSGTPWARSAWSDRLDPWPVPARRSTRPPRDEAGPHLEVVHGLDHERIACRPAMIAPGDQPDADGIATGHEPEAVVLDFVNPIRAGRRLVGWGWEAGFDEDRPVSGQALTHTPDQHAANLGGCGEESNRMTPGAFVDSRG